MKYLSLLRTRIKRWSQHVKYMSTWGRKRWAQRIRNMLTGSITVTAIRADYGGPYGKAVRSVTRTLDGKSLLIVSNDDTQTIIPFEELSAFLVTAY